MPLLDIRADHLKIVQDILQNHVPTHEVWAFGSRAKWLAKDYSDLDLCIVGDSPLSFRTLGQLEEDFVESDLPWKVDVVDWATTSESFRKIIERDRVVVHEAGQVWGMTSNWPEVRLEDVTSILGDGLHGTPAYDEDGEYFFINGNNLENGKIVLNESTKRCRKDEYLKYKKDLNDRTVLVSINGTLGNVAIYQGEKVILGKSACYFNVNSDVDRDFVRYVVSSTVFLNYIHSLATGSTIKNVSLRLMRDFSFKLPPINIQKNISKTLKDFDDKIELNRRINQTLEAMAQAIFKSWFVDFEPVKAKIAARRTLTPALSQREREQIVLRAAMSAISGAVQGSTNAASAGCAGAAQSDVELDALKNQNYVGWVSPEQSGGRNPTHNADDTTATNALGYGYRLTQPTPDEMSAYDQLAALAALFPDEMEDSVLGEVPKGWNIKRMGDLLELAYGKALKATDRRKGNIPVYGSGGITGYHDIALVPDGSIIVGRKGTVGSLFWEDGAFYPIDTTYYVKPIAAPLSYCYYAMQRLGLETMNTDAAVPGLNRENAYRLELVSPLDNVMTAFDGVVKSLRAAIQSNMASAEALATLRDILLPKLLSGELSVNAAAETTSGLGA